MNKQESQLSYYYQQANILRKIRLHLVMFILLMHHQIAIGGCHIITIITVKPYHTLSILDPSDWNHTIITVNPLFVQFKTCRSDTSHFTLVTGMCSMLLVLVL